VAREKAETAKQAAKSAKRPAPPEDTPISAKRVKVDEGKGALPAGFFSSGNRPAVDEDEDEDQDGEEEEAQAGPSTSNPTPTPVPQKQTGDIELDDFLASLNDSTESVLPATIETTQPIVTAKPGTRYKSSTVDIPSVASYEAAPIRNLPAGEEDSGSGGKEEVEEETEAQKRERASREEREEIMGRLEDEERAQ
jgi:zinc finger protein 830